MKLVEESDGEEDESNELGNEGNSEDEEDENNSDEEEVEDDEEEEEEEGEEFENKSDDEEEGDMDEEESSEDDNEIIIEKDKITEFQDSDHILPKKKTKHLYQNPPKPKDQEEIEEVFDAYHSNLELPYECDRIMTQNDFNRIKRLKKEAEAKRKRLDIGLLSDSDDESNEFLENEDLETMQMSKEEKVRLSIEDKIKQKHIRKAKKGGKTNREHAKCKPVMMVMKKKKQNMRQQFEAVKKKIRRSKQQLGKFSKRFNATKRQLK